MTVDIEYKRTWLRRGIQIKTELQMLEETRKQVFNDATRITSNYAAYKGNGQQNVHRFDRLAEIDGFILEKEQELCALRANLIKAIYTVPTLEGKQVLMCRYIHTLSLEKIAEKLSYSERHVKRIHKEALDALQLPQQAEENKGKEF